jgi:arsenate reductase
MKELTMTVKIYHNPRCSKSRATLALLNEAGIEPEIIEYMKVPLEKGILRDVIVATGHSVSEILRSGEDEYKRLNLGGEYHDDSALLDAIIAHPVLLNRPIVVTEKGARLCRPPELVHEILP